MLEDINFNLKKFEKNKYFYGKLMTVRDFEAEQEYLDGKRHLINRLLHGSGIVYGFNLEKITLSQDGTKIKFGEGGGKEIGGGGVALDCQGYEIIVPDGTVDKTVVNKLTDQSFPYYLYLKYKPCYGERVNAGSSHSSCDETCCPSRIIEDFEVIASNTAPIMEAISCPELASASNIEEIKKKIKEWREGNYKPFSGCDTSEERQVFLAAVSKNSNDEILIDKETTRKFTIFVPVQRLLLELLSCHISDFENPHRTNAEQVKALKTINEVGNTPNSTEYVENIQLSSSDKTVSIGPHKTEKNTLDFKTSAEQVKALKTINGVGNTNPGEYVANIDLVPNDSTISIIPFQDSTKKNIGLKISDNSVQMKHFSDDVFSNLLISDDNSITINQPPGKGQINIRAVSGVSYNNKITSGVATFRLEAGPQTSVWIPAGFGPGPVCVVLGLEMENIKIEDEIKHGIFTGDPEAFSLFSEIKWPPLGALVNPNSGEFKIGILLGKLSEYLAGQELSEIKIRWWAFKPGVEHVGDDNTWTYKDIVLDEGDVPILKVHIGEIQSNNGASVVIDGIWLIDFLNAIEIKSDDEFGKLNNVIINGPTIIISNDDTFTLTKDSDEEIGQEMFFEIAGSDVLRYCLFKEITDPGTYEVRGQVATGDMQWNAANFAGFYYNVDNDVSTESLTVSGINGRVIPAGGIIYSTGIKNVNYEYVNADAGWDKYPVIGFFAEQYIPLKPTDASKLAKLVLDSKDKYTLKTGDTLDLGQGYSLEAKQVDVDGEKVWLQFNKDGQYVEDQIVSTDSGDHTWTCEVDNVQGEDNVPVLKVHVNQVFQGAVDSIAQIDGIWLIDYANAMTIKSDDEFGELNNVTINGETLSITNDNILTLARDSDVEIGQGIFFKVADSDVLRYCPWKEVTNLEGYKIRGQVASGNFSWDVNNFAGFYYNLKYGVSTENLNVSGINGRVIPINGLVYTTRINNVYYKFTNWGTYPVLGFFGEEYIPIKPNNASKLSKLVLDSKDKYTLQTGGKIDLGLNYSLIVERIDVDGKKVSLIFTSNGEKVAEYSVNVSDDNT